MSTALDGIQTQHATERVELLTRDVVDSHADLRWRYDLLHSRSSPAQYYAVALRGTGADAQEVLVIAIEASVVEGEQGWFLVVSAMITDGDGAILAEADSTPITIPAPEHVSNHPKHAKAVAKAAQAAFDQMADWVNGQSDLINRVLRQAAA